LNNRGKGESIMVMWFYHDADEVEEFQAFRQEARRLEGEYLEIRVALRNAEAALRADPENADHRARVRYLAWRLRDLEKQYPWLCAETPVEVALWGTPHG
jgi:hypothetical protein